MRDMYNNKSFANYMKNFAYDTKWYVRFYFPEILFMPNSNLHRESYNKYFLYDSPFVVDISFPQQSTNMVMQSINGIDYQYATAPNSASHTINVNFRDNVNYGFYQYLTFWHDSRVNIDYSSIGGKPFNAQKGIPPVRLMNYPEDYFGRMEIILTDRTTEKRLHVFKLSDVFVTDIDPPQLRSENAELFTFSATFSYSSDILFEQINPVSGYIHKVYDDDAEVIQGQMKSVIGKGENIS
jgi:hypothetical protein